MVCFSERVDAWAYIRSAVYSIFCTEKVQFGTSQVDRGLSSWLLLVGTIGPLRGPFGWPDEQGALKQEDAGQNTWREQ
jgi:hypothetical protein